MPVSPRDRPDPAIAGPRRAESGSASRSWPSRRWLIAPRGGRAERGRVAARSGRARCVTLDALPLGVPLARLDDEARGRAEAVLGTSLFSHRVTGLRSRSREPVFRFLLDHPDFAAAVARALRLGKYQVEARGRRVLGRRHAGAPAA